MCALMVRNGNRVPLKAADIAALKSHVDMLELPACPFCGGEAQVSLNTVNSIPYAQVFCARCGGSTKPIDAVSNGMNGGGSGNQAKGFNVKLAINAAAARWKRRV